MKKIIITIIIGSFLATAYPVWAYVMSSSSYRLQSDAVSVGGVRQTSTSYISEDTIGEIATGISTSASYKIKQSDALVVLGKEENIKKIRE